MNVLLLIGLLFAIFAYPQAIARVIQAGDGLPKVLKDLIEQSAICAAKLGPKAKNVPSLSGMQQLPENNHVLNEISGCIYVKLNLMDRNGNINEENLRGHLTAVFNMLLRADEEFKLLADEATEMCKSVQANDYRVKSIRLQNCISGIAKQKMNELAQSVEYNQIDS